MSEGVRVEWTKWKLLLLVLASFSRMNTAAPIAPFHSVYRKWLEGLKRQNNLTRAVDKRSNRTLFRRSQIAQVRTAKTASGISDPTSVAS